MNYYVLNELTGEQIGPYDEGQVRQMIARKKIKPKSLVRSQESDWQRAGVLLKNQFIEVQEQSRLAKEAATEAKRARRESSEVKVDPEPAKPAKQRWSDPFGESEPPVAKPEVAPKIQTDVNSARLRHRRRGFFAQLFGPTRPSPYFGFKLAGIMINVLIGLVLVGAILAVLVGGGIGIFAAIMADLDMSAKATMILVVMGQCLAITLAAFVYVVILIYFRNLIDWMVDMQDHAAAIRSHLTGQPRQDQ